MGGSATFASCLFALTAIIAVIWAFCCSGNVYNAWERASDSSRSIFPKRPDHDRLSRIAFNDGMRMSPRQLDAFSKVASGSHPLRSLPRKAYIARRPASRCFIPRTLYRGR
jgi:hypothetical protein